MTTFWLFKEIIRIYHFGKFLDTFVVLDRLYYALSLNFYLIQYVLISCSITSRFRLINSFLRSSKTFTTNNIAMISKLHDSLCDAIYLFNSLFSFQMLTLTANLIIFNLICFFGIYHNLKTDSLTIYEEFYSIFDMIWLTYDLFFICVVLLCASLMSENTNETCSLLHKVQSNIRSRKSWKMVI